jgi:hypothetical protein
MTAAAYVNPFNLVVPLQPDFDTILNSLQRQVTNDGSLERIWTDAITAATGSYILRMVASFTADSAFTAERVQHEVMMATARRPSSIYSITKNLGVHISRKISGGVEVHLSRVIKHGQPAVKNIPAYSQWFINGLAFFNRQQIIFAAGVSSMTFTLYRGTMQVDKAFSNGTANQSFTIDLPGFYVSDVDIFCIDPQGYTWTRALTGLWQQGATSQVFYENTQLDGSVRIDFGDSVYGAIMPAGIFTINYVLVQTSSYDASQDLNPTPINSPVTCLIDTSITGITLGELSSIQPEKGPAFYQRNAPFISSGQKQGNTRDNLTALALTYPNVIDARLLGQAEINPKDLRWMNGIACCLLTSTVWALADFNQFVYYMQKYSDSTRHFYQYPPTPVVLNYTICGSLVSRANIASVQQQMRDAIYSIDPITNNPKGMLAQAQGSLGKAYTNLLTGNLLLAAATDPYGGLVTSLQIETPVNDPILLPTQYAVTGIINVNLIYDPKLTPKIVSGTVVPGGRIGLQG